MKTVIATTAAPGAIGPYSQAIEANGFVFASGQIPVIPADVLISAFNKMFIINNCLSIRHAACNNECCSATQLHGIDLPAIKLRYPMNQCFVFT